MPLLTNYEAGEDMSRDQFMRIRSDEFEAMSQRVIEAMTLTSRLNTLPFEDDSGKAALFEQILGSPLPEQTTIYPPFYTDHGHNLRLGERVFINQGCTFLDYAGITIGARTMIAANVTFITMGHPVDPGERRIWLTGAPIVVEENVWIGAGAMILPGVTIGKDSVVAAGAVVAEDVPPSSLMVGGQAVVRRRFDQPS